MTCSAQRNQVVHVVASTVTPADVVVCNRGRHPATTACWIVFQELVACFFPLCAIATLRRRSSSSILLMPRLRQVLWTQAHVTPAHQVGAPPVGTWAGG